MGIQKLEIPPNKLFGVLDMQSTDNSVNLTIIHLIQYLNIKQDGFKDLILSNGTVKPNIIILRNGRNIEFQNGINTEITDTDTIAFFPPVGGG